MKGLFYQRVIAPGKDSMNRCLPNKVALIYRLGG